MQGMNWASRPLSTKQFSLGVEETQPLQGPQVLALHSRVFQLNLRRHVWHVEKRASAILVRGGSVLTSATITASFNSSPCSPRFFSNPLRAAFRTYSARCCVGIDLATRRNSRYRERDIDIVLDQGEVYMQEAQSSIKCKVILTVMELNVADWSKIFITCMMLICTSQQAGKALGATSRRHLAGSHHLFLEVDGVLLPKGLANPCEHRRRAMLATRQHAQSSNGVLHPPLWNWWYTSAL